MSPEFSRAVYVDRISRGDVEQAIEANPDECAALAKRLQIPAVNRLTGKFTLRRSPQRSTYEVIGTIQASVTEVCVVSGEAFESERQADIRALFTEDPALLNPDPDPTSEWDDPDEIIDGRIDIGELAAQHLALALDPYPRKPGAELPTMPDTDQLSVLPFAGLHVLKSLKTE